MNNHIDDTDSGQRRMWLKWVDGTQAAADPFLMWAFGSDPDYPWTSAMVGKGKTYAIITCQYDHESMLQYPEFLFELEPLPLYDPRLDSTAGGLGAHRWGKRSTYAPSDNLAVMAYNVARGVYYGDEWLFGGQNLDAWRLPFDEWVAAMNACDEQIELADGSFERAFRGGAEISVEMEPLGVMEELGRAANMRFAEVGGRLKPICGLPGASVFSITDEDIIITEGQSYQPFLGLSATYNALTATYPEPGEKWASKDAPEFIDAVATAADDGRYLPVGVSYPAAPHANQVQRLMRAQLQDYRRMRVHQLSLPPDAYGLEPLVDMISWTSARNGYDAKRFLVMSVAKMPGMNVAVTLREVDPADYDWQPGFELPYTIVPPVNVLPFVQRIASFSAAGAVLEDSSGRGRKAAIVVGCGGDEAGVTQIRIQILKGAEAVFDVSRPYGAPYSWTISDVTPDTAYTVRACLISELTGKTEWSPDILVTTPSIEITDADLDPALRDSISDLIGFGEALTGPDGIEATLIRAKNEALAAEVGAATHAAVALAAQGEVSAAVTAAEAAALASQTSASTSGASRDAAQAAQTAAETARNQAQTSATNAGNSASTAAGSASTASTRATEAGQAASAAAASAVTAGTKATEAGTAAQAAALSESSAATFAGEAEDSASAAASSAVTANTKAGEAAGSAGAAATSAATANTKATEAGTSAAAANTAKTAAETARGQAQTAATNAATSETNAAGSANSAASSATTSASSRDAAAGSATAAAGSASLASTKATEAGNSATAANSAKTAAETARGQAQAAATSAATSETNAAGSANSAATSATTSASSRDAAAGSATAAAGSASLASTKATEAGNSATAANSAKTAAETARGQAQAAATSAATSETNAAGSANTASTHATAAAKSFLNTVMVEGNPSFDDGFASWRVNTSIPGTDLSAAHGTLASGVFTTTAGARRDVCQRKFHRLDPNRKYRARGRFKVTGGTAQIYMGCQAADGNGAITGGNAGLYYIISGGAQYPASEDWIERSSVVFTLANLKSSVTNSTAAEGVYLISLLNYAAAAGVQVALDGIWLEDVTESEATRADASASATSAALASTKATEAGTSATAAQTARTGAETARSGAEAAQTTATTAANTATGAAATATSQAALAATARTGAETARTGAEAAGAAAQAHASAANGAALSASDSAAKSLTYATNAARLMSGGVSKNPIFNLWTGTYPDHVAVTPYAGNTVTKNTANARYQNALQVVCGGTADGPLIRIDQAGQALDCSKSPRGVKIRMEIEFLSGNLANSGALLRAIWLDSGTRTEYVNLKDYMTATTGVVQVVEVYFARPAAAVPASATNFILDLFASSMLGGTRAAWQFRVHRLDFEEVLANSETAIIQQAIADVTGIKAAAIGLRATAGSAGAYLELVALDDPNGPASMARIAAGNILLEGSITADHMDIGSVRAANIDVAWLTGNRISASFLDVDSLLTIQQSAGLRYGKASVNSDNNDGIYFGHDGGRFGFAASRTSNNKRQSLKLSEDTGLQIKNARHFVSGASLPTTVSLIANAAKTALPVNTINSIEMIGGGGGGAGILRGGTPTTVVGNNGGATIVRLYDGNTLKHTFTAAGGQGGPLGDVKDYLAAASAWPDGIRGKGGNGNATWWSGGKASLMGQPGKSGQLLAPATVDTAGWLNPQIEVVVGGGGAGGSGGGYSPGHPGTAGAVTYTYAVAMDIPADVIPLEPTAVGQFTTTSTGIGSFPDLGPGMWCLHRGTGGGWIALGYVTVSPGNVIRVHEGPNATIFASQRPSYTSAYGNQVVWYSFYAMSTWG
ncbi:phage tail protein [Pseudogemmobacter faecipullorum]|uniref:Tip attachment protein J domain-containing protein n=1 Tax=Pseudogemmobacter faecipullorum TaxID=2755041 RepID=A0ABS8CSF7_9RHOB|nr:phage tail protein [Pseudogemmobacter faecipullorum]MCB5412298.1 hypothetical protein [Pseudogemmobacter faecipullorum]